MAGKPRRVIITRPAQDAAHWVEELTNKGFNAQALPLIEIGPASGKADILILQDTFQRLADYAAAMFVSGNAVQYFFQQKKAADQLKHAQPAIKCIAEEAFNTLPPNLRFFAPGPATAAALRAAGVPATQIDSPLPDSGQFDSEALWQVVGSRDWHAKRVLLLRGLTHGVAASSATGRDWLTQQLRAAGARVDMVTVYERRSPQLSRAQIDWVKKASHDRSVWLFSSSEALANLMQQTLLAAVDWRGACAIATHPRIAQAVRAAGWGVVQESRPLLSDIVSALRSIESSDS